MAVVLQEVTFMKTNKNVLASGLLESLNSQKNVFGVKLAQQTRVGPTVWKMVGVVYIRVVRGMVIPER